jgi:hypothetical protein
MFWSKNHKSAEWEHAKKTRKKEWATKFRHTAMCAGLPRNVCTSQTRSAFDLRSPSEEKGKSRFDVASTFCARLDAIFAQPNVFVDCTLELLGLRAGHMRQVMADLAKCTSKAATAPRSIRTLAVVAGSLAECAHTWGDSPPLLKSLLARDSNKKAGARWVKVSHAWLKASIVDRQTAAQEAVCSARAQMEWAIIALDTAKKRAEQAAQALEVEEFRLHGTVDVLAKADLANYLRRYPTHAAMPEVCAARLDTYRLRHATEQRSHYCGLGQEPPCVADIVAAGEVAYKARVAVEAAEATLATKHADYAATKEAYASTKVACLALQDFVKPAKSVVNVEAFREVVATILGPCGISLGKDGVVGVLCLAPELDELLRLYVHLCRLHREVAAVVQAGDVVGVDADNTQMAAFLERCVAVWRARPPAVDEKQDEEEDEDDDEEENEEYVMHIISAYKPAIDLELAVRLPWEDAYDAPNVGTAAGPNFRASLEVDYGSARAAIRFARGASKQIDGEMDVHAVWEAVSSSSSSSSDV